jgi:hypothetical protein
MGGLFNKNQKDQIIGINSKIGKDVNCNICGRLLGKKMTFYEINKHMLQCQNKNKKLESMIKDLRNINNEHNNLIKQSYLLKYGDHENRFENHNSNDEIIEENIIHPRVNVTRHNSHKICHSSDSSNQFQKEERCLKNYTSHFKKDINSDMLIFDPFLFKDINESRSHSHKKNSHKHFILNIDSNFLKELPFEDKVLEFKKFLKNLKIDWREGSCSLQLDRENILKQSIEQFSVIDPYKELKINFKGEISHDAGGLIREWYTVIFQEIQSEKLSNY